MTTNSPIEVKTGGNRPLWTGILLVGLGAIALFLPVVSTLVTETWIAFILLTVGFSKLFYAFQTRAQGGFLWKTLLSVLYLGAGGMLLVNPFGGTITLTLLLGSFLLAEAVVELVLAFRLRPQSNWTWALGNALFTLGLGAIVWFGWPGNAPWLLGTVVGASVISTGLSRIMLSLNPRIAGSGQDQIDQAASI